MPFAIFNASAELHRVAFGRNAADIPKLRPWDSVTAEHPRAERWDDRNEPPIAFRVLYTSDTREGAYRETLQDLRPSQKYLNRLKTLDLEAEDPSLEVEDRSVIDAVGTLPLDWLLTRVVGTIACNSVSPCVDVTDSKSLDELYDLMRRPIDADNLLGADMEMYSRPVSTAIWCRPDDFHGIAWPSRLGRNFMNYAFFETGPATDELRASITPVEGARIRLDDAAFRTTLAAYHLIIREDDQRFYMESGGQSWDEYLDQTLMKIEGTAELQIVRTDVTPVARAGRILEFVGWSTPSDKVQAYAIRSGLDVAIVGLRKSGAGTQTVPETLGTLRDVSDVAERLLEILAEEVDWQ